MASSFSLVIVHYHLRTGGVSRVVERAAEALRQRGVNVAVMVGEAPPDDSPLAGSAVVVDGLGYDEPNRMADPDLLYDRMTAAARAALGKDPDLWHVHNHAVGKNGALPIVVKRLAEQGCRLLLQCHDFAEDGRPVNYGHLIGATGGGDPSALDDWLYPRAEHVHYGLLNQRDRNLLIDAGFDPDLLHVISNPVVAPMTEQATDPPRTDSRRFILYPVRAIRRKNLGEFLLWTLLGREDERFAVTLPATSPTEKPYYERWKQFANEQRIDIEFDYTLTSGLPFSQILRSADALVTTSIAEGFGLAFLEPWLVERPIVGRNLPDITDDFRAHGVDLSHLYHRLDVPESWFDGLPLAERLEQSLAATRRAYRKPCEYRHVDRALGSICREGGIDFGRIDEPLQETVLRRLQSDPGAVEAIRPGSLNPSDACDAQTIEKNASIVREQYNPNSYAHQLRNLYGAMLLTGPGTVEMHSASAVLDVFLDPERFNMLRAVHE